MTNPLTAWRDALIARLQTITIANGYKTDSGSNVLSGWFNEIVQSGQRQFPMIVVQRGKASRQSDPFGNAIAIPMALNVIGAVNVGFDYEQTIDDLTFDLARCLLPQDLGPVAWASPEMYGIAISAPEVFPPGDGVAVATVLIGVECSILIE